MNQKSKTIIKLEYDFYFHYSLNNFCQTKFLCASIDNFLFILIGSRALSFFLFDIGFHETNLKLKNSSFRAAKSLINLYNLTANIFCDKTV